MVLKPETVIQNDTEKLQDFYTVNSVETRDSHAEWHRKVAGFLYSKWISHRCCGKINFNIGLACKEKCTSRLQSPFSPKKSGLCFPTISRSMTTE